jgi:hypothetical protein
MSVATHLIFEADRNDLAGLGVIAEPRAVRHPNELVFHDRVYDFEGLGYDPL